MEKQIQKLPKKKNLFVISIYIAVIIGLFIVLLRPWERAAASDDYIDDRHDERDAERVVYSTGYHGKSGIIANDLRYGRPVGNCSEKNIDGRDYDKREKKNADNAEPGPLEPASAGDLINVRQK